MLPRVALSLTLFSALALFGCSSFVDDIDRPSDHSSPPPYPPWRGPVLPQPSATEPGEPPPVNPPPKVACAVTWSQSDHQDNITLSNGDLTATTSTTNDGVRAMASHKSGQWYWEITFDKLVSKDYQAVGASTQGLNLALGLTTCSSGQCAGYGPNGELPYGSGDTLGVAVDLDKGLIYFSKNGQWLKGASPELGTGGVPILVVPGTGTYYPTAFLSSGDVITANFGVSPFKSEVPKGYSSFAAGLEPDAAGRCVDEGPVGIPATPAPVQVSCTDFTSYLSDAKGSPELDVIGTYAPSASGTTTVHVTRKSPLILALSAYEITHWKVMADPGVQIQRIILSGFHTPKVTAPPGIPVEIHSYALNNYLDTGFRWPSDFGGGNTPGLVKKLENLTGQTLTSFAGCYTGGLFVLHD
jgi:hypothetical protein